MVVNVEDNVKRVVILDISGVYVQIHNQGYFDSDSINDIQMKYSDQGHWRVLVFD